MRIVRGFESRQGRQLRQVAQEEESRTCAGGVQVSSTCLAAQ